MAQTGLRPRLAQVNRAFCCCSKQACKQAIIVLFPSGQWACCIDRSTRTRARARTLEFKHAHACMLTCHPQGTAPQPALSGPISLCACTPQVLWSAAALRARPSRSWLRAMHLRMLHLAAAPAMLPTELALCMSALPRLGLDRVSRAEAAALLSACLRMVATAPPPPSPTAPSSSPQQPQQQQQQPVDNGAPGALPGFPVAPAGAQVRQPPAQLVDPRSPSTLLRVLRALCAWRVRPSAAWWSALLAAPAWEACLLRGHSGATPGAATPWGPRPLVQLLQLLQQQRVQPPARWVAALRRRALLELRPPLPALPQLHPQPAQLADQQGPLGR